MSDLALKKCAPLTGETRPFSEQEEYDYLSRVRGWSVGRKHAHQIRKLFQFEDFREAVAFVNEVAQIAEEENHHPDIFLSYRHVTVSVWTRKIGGLSENDFILAAKIDAIGK